MNFQGDMDIKIGANASLDVEVDIDIGGVPEGCHDYGE